MRVVIQRVSHASVTINGNCKSAINRGMLILVGIEEADGTEDIDMHLQRKVTVRRILKLPNRIFQSHCMNNSAQNLVLYLERK